MSGTTLVFSEVVVGDLMILFIICHMLACPSIRIRHLTSHAFANRKRVTPPRSQCCPVLRKTHRFDSENNLLLYERGFSFFSFHSADRPTPETFTTLNRTPGISPFAFPLRPKPARRTSSFSSTKLRQPSLGTKFSNQPSVLAHPVHFL